MKTTLDVSIIIVSYNVASLLDECLRSVFERVEDGLAVETIVVDNASSDNSPQLIKEKFPQVKLIENEHNLGFPCGCNQGLRAAQGRYLFFLNPDAKLEPSALASLVKLLEERPQAGIVGPMLRYGDGSLQSNRRRFPGRVLALVESTTLQLRRPFKNWQALDRFYMKDMPVDYVQKVDWLVGAAFLVRRDVIEQIGGLDERFFMYSEEVDFCRRAALRNWECWYTPDAVVTHQEGQSSVQNKPQRYINFNASKVTYFRKWYGPLFAEFLRFWLLALYILEYAEEGIKLLLRHKPELRRERLAIFRQVLASGLRPYCSPYPHTLSEKSLCLISAEYPPQPGGVGDYTAKLAEQFSLLNPSLSILTTKEVTSNKDKSEVGSIKSEEFTDKWQPTTNNPKNSVLNPQSSVLKWNWSCLPKIAKELKLRPVDAVIIQYQTGAYRMHPAINFLPLYLRWKMGASRPLIATTFHDLLVPYLFPKAGRVRRWVNQVLLRSSDRAIVTNPEDYQKALEWGANPEKLHLVPIGSNITRPEVPLSFKERTILRQSWGLDEKDFAIGYFGLLNRSKGVATLLEALAELRKAAEGKSWKLIIIGGETGQTDATNQVYARELEEMIKRLNLEKAVIRTGYLAPLETSHALLALDAMALPFRDGASFRRGSLLAPLAHGVPIVTTRPPILNFENFPTNSAFLPQLLDEQNVLYTEPENPVALAHSLQQLREDPLLRAQLAAGGLELSRHFSWESIAAALLKIL